MQPSAVHKNPLEPGKTTIPSLLQVYLSKDVGNEEVEKLQDRTNQTFEIKGAANIFILGIGFVRVVAEDALVIVKVPKMIKVSVMKEMNNCD